MAVDTTIKSAPTRAWHALAILGIVAILVAMSTGTGASRKRPLKIIVPFGAGGGSDAFVRMIQKAITDEGLTSQPWVIINQGGGSGTIGSRTVMTAAADGFTILNLHEGMMTAKLSGKVPYGPEAFEPIAATGRASMMVIVPEDSRFQSLKQLMAEARAKPETIKFGANVGAPAHFAGILLERAVEGARFRTVQSGGGQQRYTLLIGGHLDMGIFSLDEFLNYRGGGGIRALAVLDVESNTAIPDVPTAKSQGIDVIHHNTQYWWAPKGTPTVKIDAIAALLEKAMNTDGVKAELARTHTEALFARGDALMTQIAERMETLGQVDLSHRAELPNFPLIVSCVVAGLFLWVIVSDRSARGKEAAQAIDRPRAQLALAWAAGVITLIYVALLQLRIVRFAILTTIFVLVIGALLSARLPRKPWLALGEVALLCGLGLEFVFKRVLVIDLP